MRCGSTVVERECCDRTPTIPFPQQTSLFAFFGILGVAAQQSSAALCHPQRRRPDGVKPSRTGVVSHSLSKRQTFIKIF
jgi:hypothetical protein